jgi:UDP-N-acetylglucosamine acyltransferase
MAKQSPPRIHASAVISAEAELATDVRVGAGCVIHGQVRVGPGCRLDAGSFLFGPLVLGADNHVHGRAVLGERAQHLSAGGSMGLEVGAGNTFWPRVTVHQGYKAMTRVGSRNRFFADAHVAHDCQVGDDCVFAGGALIGGHCVVGNGVRLGRRAAVHQFCRLGRLCRLGPAAVSTKDVPPFILQKDHNTVVGVNVAAMLRRALKPLQIAALERLYGLFYLQAQTVPAALEEIERELGSVDVVAEFVDFVRAPGRGINFARHGLTIGDQHPSQP